RHRLARRNVDARTVRRKVVVANGDLVLAFAQRQLGQRRRGAGGLAVDLDLAPRADGDAHDAGGGRRRGRSAEAGIALARFADALVAGRFLRRLAVLGHGDDPRDRWGDRGGGRRGGRLADQRGRG